MLEKMCATGMFVDTLHVETGMFVDILHVETGMFVDILHVIETGNERVCWVLTPCIVLHM